MRGSRPVLVEYSSISVPENRPEKFLSSAQTTCAKHGFTFGIQVHNITPEEELIRLINLGVPLTFHAPVLGKHLLNFAARDVSAAFESLATTVEWMGRAQAKLALFHGFVMTDAPLENFGAGKKYVDVMAPAYRPELSLDESGMCRDYFSLPEHRERLELVNERLREIEKRFPGKTFCIENDFPMYGSGFLLSDQARQIHHPLCMDLGHLWAASHLLDRDFHGEVEKFLETGRVRVVHLHASRYDSKVAKNEWGDGHRPLNTPNSMDLPRVVRACRAAGVRHFTLEIRGVSEADIHLLGKMWEA